MAISERRAPRWRPGQRMTLGEFLALPEEKPYLELHDGVVVQKVSPQEQHGALQQDFGLLLSSFVRPRRLARVFSELRWSFGESFLVPDLSVYRWERVRRLPSGELANVSAGPPDIVGEILSPDQTLRELIAKCRVYAQNGVQITLLVNPKDKSVRYFLSDGSVTTWRGDDRIDLDSVLPGFELTVQALFDTLLD